MDSPHFLHKSTISPSGSDLCLVRDTCNWGWAVAVLLAQCACIRACACVVVYVLIQNHTCTRFTFSKVLACVFCACSDSGRQIFFTSTCCTFFPLLSSTFLLFPPQLPFTAASPLERFHHPSKGLNSVFCTEYKAGKEMCGRSVRDMRCLS